MARPISVTDEEILDATERVAARFGLHGLTVSEVAREVGLTRAAISLRFEGVPELKRLLLERMVTAFQERLQGFSPEPGAQGLLLIAERIGGMMRGREQFRNFWTRHTLNLADPVALEMEERRGALLRRLIADAMPETAIPRDAAVEAFMAQLTGSMMHWQASTHPDPAAFLRDRAADWIRLAHIPMGEAQ